MPALAPVGNANALEGRMMRTVPTNQATPLATEIAGFCNKIGTSRQFAAVPNFGSDRSEADILRAPGGCRSHEMTPGHVPGRLTGQAFSGSVSCVGWNGSETPCARLRTIHLVPGDYDGRHTE